MLAHQTIQILRRMHLLRRFSHIFMPRSFLTRELRYQVTSCGGVQYYKFKLLLFIGFPMIIAFFMVWFLASRILLREDDIFKCMVDPTEHLITHSLFRIQPVRIVLLTIT